VDASDKPTAPAQSQHGVAVLVGEIHHRGDTVAGDVGEDRRFTSEPVDALRWWWLAW
jgi:hypothetical protein